MQELQLGPGLLTRHKFLPIHLCRQAFGTLAIVQFCWHIRFSFLRPNTMLHRLACHILALSAICLPDVAATDSWWLLSPSALLYRADLSLYPLRQPGCKSFAAHQNFVDQ